MEHNGCGEYPQDCPVFLTTGEWIEVVALAQPFTPVRCHQILVWADGNDAGRIEFAMGAVVVPFDVIEVHRVGDAVGLIQISQIAEEVRIIDDAPEVAFEMAVVHGIEPDQRHEQPPVGLDEFPPK